MDDRTLTRCAWLALLHFALVGGFVVSAALAAMPFHTVNLPQHVQGFVLQLAPEGWGFFTKSPRDPEIHVAQLSHGRLRSLNIASSFSAEFAFGFNRLGRAQGIEVDTLLLQLNNPSLWHECTRALESCLRNLKPQTKLENAARRPTLCGDMVFAESRPVPWAYSRLARPVVMRSRLTRVEVVCSNA